MLNFYVVDNGAEKDHLEVFRNSNIRGKTVLKFDGTVYDGKAGKAKRRRI